MSSFSIGDRVRVRDNGVIGAGVFDGFQADVVGSFEDSNTVFLMPLSERPDGHGWDKFYWPESRVELVTDAQTIEVGDTVKSTHAESGSVVRGVAAYTNFDQDNFEIDLSGDQRLDLYASDGWTFEVVSKAVTPPKVGDKVQGDLPIGTTVKSRHGLFALRTPEGWSTTNDTTVPHLQTENWTITYLPESAND